VYDVQLGPGIFIDTEPSFTPDFQAAGLIRYTWPQPVVNGRLFAQASFNYASEFYDNIRNFEASELPDYFIGNVRLGWVSADDSWEAAVFVNNVADLSNATGSNSLVPGKPRWFGVSLRYNFF
jgi:hypothetical protein